MDNILNRRKMFGVLAGLPLVGFLFGSAKAEPTKMNIEGQLNLVSIKDGVETIIPIKEGAAVPLYADPNSVPVPYVHIYHENGMMTAIPLDNTFLIYIRDVNGNQRTIYYEDGVLRQHEPSRPSHNTLPI